MKKKILIIFAMLLVIVSLAFIGAKKTTNQNEDDKLNILTTFYPVYLFTQNVTEGTDVVVKNLDVDSAGCLHGYQLTTGNMKDVESADVIVINGAEMEKTFIYDIKELYPDKLIIDTSVGVELINSKFEDEVNSHIWLSVANAKIQVNNIAKELSKYDEENAYVYIENANKYVAKLDELSNSYGKKEINVVAMHDSISYFAKDLGLNVVDIIQNDEEDTSTPKRNIEIANNMKANNVKVILIENTYSDRLAISLAEETGAKIYYFDSITSGSGNATEYIEKMQKNYDMINEIDE
ncbi:MAG: zinc ABC transporter substrate-binding protein [Clostridiales bacterium]|nr:zinc ABC transporter substrate-binding protein [Clostridiales bacterium]